MPSLFPLLPVRNVNLTRVLQASGKVRREPGAPCSLFSVGGFYVSVSSRPSSISARISHHGHFREHGHYRGQKDALHQQTLDYHRTQPAV
ncbi:hypothetical protein ARC310_10410 [Pantoea ananatis]|nr:hypothetical protein ARC310_10410 [Pantoea ananatis]PZD64920.1 hypothetical protein ARC311_10955 [Pantoea ananatis]